MNDHIEEKQRVAKIFLKYEKDQKQINKLKLIADIGLEDLNDNEFYL